MSIELEAILSKVEKLNDKLTLVHKINSFLHLSKKNNSITELKGLGAQLWKNVDVDNYVNKEREW